MQNDLEQLYEPIKRKVADSLGQWMQEGTSDVLNKMNAIASAMEKMSEQLENDGEPEIAELARSGSESVRSMSDQMKDADPKKYFNLIEEQGQKHPAGAFVASLALGFTTSRAAKQMYKGQTESSHDSLEGQDSMGALGSDSNTSDSLSRPTKQAPVRDSATGSAGPPSEVFNPPGSRASGQDFRS